MTNQTRARHEKHLPLHPDLTTIHNPPDNRGGIGFWVWRASRTSFLMRSRWIVHKWSRAEKTEEGRRKGSVP